MVVAVILPFSKSSFEYIEPLNVNFAASYMIDFALPSALRVVGLQKHRLACLRAVWSCACCAICEWFGKPLRLASTKGSTQVLLGSNSFTLSVHVKKCIGAADCTLELGPSCLEQQLQGSDANASSSQVTLLSACWTLQPRSEQAEVSFACLKWTQPLVSNLLSSLLEAYDLPRIWLHIRRGWEVPWLCCQVMKAWLHTLAHLYSSEGADSFWAALQSDWLLAPPPLLSMWLEIWNGMEF